MTMDRVIGCGMLFDGAFQTGREVCKQEHLLLQR